LIKKRKRRLWFLTGALIGVVAGAIVVGAWYRGELAPMPEGEPVLVRYEEGTTFDGVMLDLEKRGVVRNPAAVKVYCYLQRADRTIYVGTFEFQPGMNVEQVLRTLKRPIEQQVRIPEGWWIARSAKILEKNRVCSAQEYLDAAHDPARFVGDVSFPLPEGSLEGFLYPDTYDLPPLIGADAVVRRQLQAFEEKVWKPAQGMGVTPEALNRALVVASMVELEAAVDPERPMIAGVIENRIKINQNLEIDATVLYAIQDWRVLQRGEVRTIVSPYNTYLNSGLPPGPIGSPAWRSVSAALAPEQHEFLYYVARPDRTHFFSSTYTEHRQNINKSRKEFAEGGDA
jgi:UPF0755 protein